MASILRVNTLTDASSNNSIATSFVAGGSAKAWIDHTQITTSAIRDSLILVVLLMQEQERLIQLLLQTT